MIRTLNALLVMSLVFGSTFGLVGCRFCASPFDYCCPTYTGNNCDYYCSDPCDPNYVAGSRFAGTENVCQTGCSTCGEVITSPDCSSCSTGCSDYSGYSSDGSDAYYESVGYEYENEPTAPTRKVNPNGNNIQKIPPPPAVPQKIQVPAAVKKTPSASALRSQKVSPQTAYASHVNAADQAPISLAELRELNPDAVDVRIIGVQEQR